MTQPDETLFDDDDLAELDAATFDGDLRAQHYCEDCGALVGECGACCPNNDPWQHWPPS